MLHRAIAIPICLLVLGAARPAPAQTFLSDPIPEPIPPSPIQVKLTPVLTGLTSPLELKAPGRHDRVYILDQTGLILVLRKNGQVLPQKFLDITGVMAQLAPAFGSGPMGLNPGYDERGLLSMAFHPGFHDKKSPGYGKFYTLHNVPVTRVADFPQPQPPLAPAGEPNCQEVIAEWRVSRHDPDVADPSSYRELLRSDKPQFNHNGGSLAFGPDGLLYASLGDGGAANDVGPGHLVGTGNAQSLMSIRGKVIRINPLHPALTSHRDGSVSANGQYRIPRDNPFVNRPDALGEIYAYGFRNPYRFSFDFEDGEDDGEGRLVLGDVGQNQIEEVDIVRRGGNYGWNLKEGTFRFDPSNGRVFAGPNPVPGLIDPVVEYDHFEATAGRVTRQAVVGGFVYRGSKIKALRGKYVFGELNGNLFVADLKSGRMEELIPDVGMFIKGFGQDAKGQLYVLGSTIEGPSGTGGQVLRIDRVHGDHDQDQDEDHHHRKRGHR